jgi:molecular chaperone GrpE (heat shock protein)
MHIFGGVAINKVHYDPLKETSPRLVKAATATTKSPRQELMDKAVADFEKIFKEMKESVDEIQDPGMKKFVKCMTSFMDLYWDDMMAAQTNLSGI